MTRGEWMPGPFGLDAAEDRTVRCDSTILTVVHSVTTGTRLADMPLTESDQKSQLAALLARWRREKAEHNLVDELKRLIGLRFQVERAQRNLDLEMLSWLMFGEIPALELEIAEARAMAEDDIADGSPVVRPEVGPDDVVDVVSTWTGISAEPLPEDKTTIVGHVFMSYARENSAEADGLRQMLEAAGIRVWRDTADLWPGEDWREKIRHAIIQDSLVFLACFSQKSVSREISYQNEELNLAVEQMRTRRPDHSWLIPIRFDDCDIPDLSIDSGRSLGSIQRVDLFGDHGSDAAVRLVSAIHRILKSRR